MLKNPYYVYGDSELYVPVRLNFGDFIINKLLSYKDKTALINPVTKESLTFSQIAQQSINFSISLSRLGVRKGDTIAICSENRQEFWSAVIGAACTGATITTVNIGYTKSEFKHVMNISKPKYVITSPFFYKSHGKNMGFAKNVIIFGNENNNDTILYNDMVRNDVEIEDFVAVDVKGESDVLFILYSSGTTGLPKGVMITHLNVLTVCNFLKNQTPNAMNLTVAPWFHVMGLMSGFSSLTIGRTSVYLPKFDVKTYFEAVETYKIPQLTVVPPALIALCKSPLKYDLSSVEVIYSGAAPLRKDIIGAVKEKFPNARGVFQGYGLTESTFGIIRTAYDDIDKAKPGSVGTVVPGTIVKVVDVDTRKVLGPNQRGELCIKGAMVMKGYVGKTSGDDFDDEGFFKTGDVGYYDDDKQFFIVDRLKELIKYKGFQVPPAEIEAVLLQHEGIRDAGVVGIEHSSAGEVPLAFVVSQPGQKLTVDDVKKFVAEKLSNPKHLRGGVRFVNEIPKNPSGKIVRKELRRMAKAGKSKL